MAENKIELKAIGDLLGMNFFIPSYQRGYRWTSRQVKELLDDIYEFACKPGKTDKEFYCLQPIVVRQLSSEEVSFFSLKSDMDDNQWYEVIDGQQRLTTIRILITYLEKKYLGGSFEENECRKPFAIFYQTRKNSQAYLADIDPAQSDEYIDYYHINDAYNTIDAWFKKQANPRSAKTSILNTITLTMAVPGHSNFGVVQVIWYQINDISAAGTDSSTAIDLFTRINLGKIPLRNAELIKALFLQEKNFKTVPILKQIEMANEWDRMEFALQDDDFWLFLNKEENNVPARIEFLFNIIYDIERSRKSTVPIPEKDGKSELELFDELYGNQDAYATFRFFNDKFKTHSKEEVDKNWMEVKRYFMTFEEWFQDPVYYHYIGYLIACGVSIIKIYQKCVGVSKKSFLDALKNDKEIGITKTVEGVETRITKFPKENREDVFINLAYSNNSSTQNTIRRLLLLYNIEYIVKQNSGKKENQWYIRFPFDIYKKGKWDIEHINSYTTNEIRNLPDMKTWIRAALDDLKAIRDVDSQLEKDIDMFIADQGKFDYTGLKNRIAALAGEDIEDDDDEKNNIGNLTLLNAEINRSYGNDLFPTKRKRIIAEDAAGQFIPICTKNVFLKYHDASGGSRTIWSNSNGDFGRYRAHIYHTLSEFLPAAVIVTESSDE